MLWTKRKWRTLWRSGIRIISFPQAQQCLVAMVSQSSQMRWDSRPYPYYTRSRSSSRTGNPCLTEPADRLVVCKKLSPGVYPFLRLKEDVAATSPPVSQMTVYHDRCAVPIRGENRSVVMVSDVQRALLRYFETGKQISMSVRRKHFTQFAKWVLMTASSGWGITTRSGTSI